MNAAFVSAFLFYLFHLSRRKDYECQCLIYILIGGLLKLSMNLLHSIARFASWMFIFSCF